MKYFHDIDAPSLDRRTTTRKTDMADADEESDEDIDSFKKPLELFEEREIVRICAPMVRYSK